MVKSNKNSFYQPPSTKADTETIQTSAAELNKLSSDEEIKAILENVGTLTRFREMVYMNLKKKDLSTEILMQGSGPNKNEIILPVNSFKQCLKVIGVNLTHEVSFLFNLILFSKSSDSLLRVMYQDMVWHPKARWIRREDSNHQPMAELTQH